MVEKKEKLMTVDDLIAGADGEDEFFSFTRKGAASGNPVASDRMRNRVNISSAKRRDRGGGAGGPLTKEELDFADLLGEKKSATSSSGNDPTTTSDETPVTTNRVSTRNLVVGGGVSDSMKEVQQQ